MKIKDSELSQPRFYLAPDEEAGFGPLTGPKGDLPAGPGPEKPQPNLLPADPLLETQQDSPVSLESSIGGIRPDFANSPETADPPPLTGGAPGKLEGPAHKRGELVDLSNQPESVDCHSTYLDMKGLNWTEDLSPDGQWLFKELLIGAEDIQLLEQYARADGIDLDAAMKELDQYALIDRSEPGFFHLPWQKIPPRW